MNHLFAEQLAPLTSEIGFVEMSSQAVAGWFEGWDSRNVSRLGVEVSSRPVSGPLQSLLRKLEPLTSVQPRRFLFCSTSSKWTAYFDNSWRGADAGSLCHMAALQLRCRAVRVHAVSDTLDDIVVGSSPGRYGGAIFELYNSDALVRSVAAINDGGAWTFEQSGEPLPTEDLDNYRARRRKDRFDLAHLARILGYLEIDAFRESFYRDDGILVERKGHTPAILREYSLGEARATMGYEAGRTNT
jgi:hypothetical protein